MFKHIIIALALTATPAFAQKLPDISALIASDGLATTETMLAERSPDPTTNFALGGVRFLRAIEVTLQTRWRLGINADRSELPVLRLPVPANPAPDPFTPDAIAKIFDDLTRDLDAARAPLDLIGDTDAVDLPITLTDLWFDINLNGTRDDGEDITDIGGRALTGRPVTMIESPVLHFDSADAAWLSAYTHFLSAFAQLVLAYDPTPQIARVTEASKAMDAVAADSVYPNAFDMLFGQQIDRIAMVYFTLKQQPDPQRTVAARDHMLAMIDRNRVFWARVANETDDAGEWIPNDNQLQGLGMNVPKGTGARWQAVLADAEALLNGTRLIPHWRFREGAGVNLKKLLENPVPIDVPEWAHGIGLLPYIEEGQRVSIDSWNDFQRLLQGDGLLYVVFLN